MSIKLYDASSLSQEFSNSETNLKKDGVSFVKADVSSGTWIFYTHANNNDKEAGAGPSNHKVVGPGTDINISGVNGSMFLVPDQVEGILLFEHFFYGGTNKWFEESCANVNPYFQSGKGEGVSSAIVLSKNQKFAIFAKPNYQGLQQQLEPDTRYATPDAMKFPNDRLQSFRKK
ncbi:uncharacterized protein [Pocillopora verrucosa]|uniref:uncharacterized protein n=1 Tax=Pocillopora verrucosa TaxID=203993 RepID=UPI00333E348C